MNHRDDWDLYFMRIAHAVATRATCNRRHVGAVIVNCDRVVLSTGYNGSLRRLSHCDDVGHLMIDGHCERTVHAEANAIAHAARNGVPLISSTLYATTFPCFNCFKLVANSGICRIVYDSLYVDKIDGVVESNASEIGIVLHRLELVEKPIDMLLYCPVCDAQHIDAPSPEDGWENPPHRSHKCDQCGAIWRPSDHTTNGVLSISTKGKRDTWYVR